MVKPKLERLKETDKRKYNVPVENRFSPAVRHYPSVNPGRRIATRSKRGYLYSRNYFKNGGSSADAQIYIAQSIAVELPDALSGTAQGMVDSILGGVLNG